MQYIEMPSKLSALKLTTHRVDLEKTDANWESGLENVPVLVLIGWAGNDMWGLTIRLQTGGSQLGVKLQHRRGRNIGCSPSMRSVQ